MNARTLSSIQALAIGGAFEMPDYRRYAAPMNAPIIGEAIAPIANDSGDSTDHATLADSPSTLGSAIVDTNDRRRFITGGKAIFTIAGLQARYTFQVTRKDPDPGSRYTDPAYFVGMLTGPNNLDDYSYIGMLDTRSGKLVLTRKSRLTADSQPVKAFNWAIGRIWRSADIAPAQFYHIGKCGRCGKALTVPESISCGFGPECLGKLGE